MNHKRIAAPLMALLLLVTAVAGGAAAASFDSETTTTTTESDISGTSTSVDFYPGNSSKSIYVETDGASTSNLTLELSPAQEGVDMVAYSNDSAATEDATNGHYSWTVTHDELSDLPRTADGGVYTAEVVADNGTVVSSTELDLQTVDDQDAFLAVASAGSDGAMTSLVSDELTLESQDAGFLGGLFGSESTDIATWSGYTEVNGSQSDVSVLLENGTTADAYSSTSADAEDGEWIRGSTMWVNGMPHKVYKNEAPEGANGTTVVYDNSTEQVDMNLGEEYDDTQTLSLRATAGDGYGFGEVWSNFGVGDAFGGLIPV